MQSDKGAGLVRAQLDHALCLRFPFQPLVHALEPTASGFPLRLLPPYPHFRSRLLSCSTLNPGRRRCSAQFPMAGRTEEKRIVLRDFQSLRRHCHRLHIQNESCPAPALHRESEGPGGHGGRQISKSISRSLRVRDFQADWPGMTASATPRFSSWSWRIFSSTVFSQIIL